MHLQQSLFLGLYTIPINGRSNMVNMCQLGGYAIISLNIGMMDKKKINEIVVKKTAPVRLLIKCYVCNKLFNTQPQFNTHLQQHQSKLNRTNLEEIQRKTQESFRSKRQPSAKVISAKRQESLKTEEESPKQKNQQQSQYISQKQEEQQEQQLEEALRESQILLQKIEFITQVTQTTNDRETFGTNIEQDKDQECTIDTEYHLYLQLMSKPTPRPQTLILKTNFQDRSFQNYQEQLKHLSNLKRLSINSDSISKIERIINNICKDVIDQLKDKYGGLGKQTSIMRQQQIIESGQNQGEVAFCSICFGKIEVSSGFLHSQLGTVYHKECYQQG